MRDRIINGLIFIKFLFEKLLKKDSSFLFKQIFILKPKVVVQHVRTTYIRSSIELFLVNCFNLLFDLLSVALFVQHLQIREISM